MKISGGKKKVEYSGASFVFPCCLSIIAELDGRAILHVQAPIYWGVMN
jgi:hypothetical protein